MTLGKDSVQVLKETRILSTDKFYLVYILYETFWLISIPPFPLVFSSLFTNSEGRGAYTSRIASFESNLANACLVLLDDHVAGLTDPLQLTAVGSLQLLLKYCILGILNSSPLRSVLSISAQRERKMQRDR
mgnify:CR=1 FL=1